MKHLLCKVMIATTILLSSCGNGVVVSKKIKDTQICKHYEIDNTDPRYVVCYLISEITWKEDVWHGIIDYWIPEITKNEYPYRWYEYTDGTHAIRYYARG